MKKFLCNVHRKALISEVNRQYKRFFSFFILNFLFVSFIAAPSFSQGVIPTKGKDFWIGFPYAPGIISGNPASKRCDVFITSDISTTGVIMIPQQAWSQVFTVTAFQTTTITIPVNLVEHTTSEIVENKGVEVVTQDTVSVFAISFQEVSADGTVVYPKQSLGTDYRIGSYQGINYPLLNSDFEVVATEDNTQISITPTAPTLAGNPAGVPFIVNLNAGESYQVLASQYTDDFTGTTIKGTDSSGTCRLFAVFSGAACVNIPNGCYACDVLYEQALPVADWGKTYYSVPFSFASNYTLRILADQNNTSYLINGSLGPTLNAGQFTEINNITTPQCIVAFKPVSVIQYMQGLNCAGAGDPSMMYLNAEDQKIDRITFSTVTSAIINQHDVNVIMNTSHISQLTLDGVPVPSASFSPMTFCNTISYAQLTLTQGSHTLAADSGFTAYIYGTGSYESYAYSVGSFSKTQPIVVDSVLCSTDTVHLGTTNTLFSAWWSTNTNPNDTIGNGPLLTLTPPIVSDIYIEHGFEFISGCAKNYYFNVEVPDTPQTFITANATTTCQNQQVQLTAGTIPASSVYQYSWTPVTGLNNPNIANPVATTTVSMWYYVTISSPTGCVPTVHDSIYLTVLPIPLPNVSGGINQSICLGTSATLSASGGVSYLWVPGNDTLSTITVSPTTTTNYIVFVTDTNGCGNSDTVTVAVNAAPTANAGADQSICGGGTATLTATGGGTYLWSQGGTISSITVSPPVSTTYTVQVTGANGCTNTDSVHVAVGPLPTANAGADQDICSGSSATLTASGGTSYLWTPGAFTTSSITVSPSATTAYIVQVTDANGCQNTDTVLVTINPAPPANAGADQDVCSGSNATLIATGGASYLWNPTGNTNDTITVSPLSTTNYIVTVTDTNGCVKKDTVTVTVNPLPLANAGANQAICTGANATLTATGGGSYLWTPGGGTSSSIVVSPATSTNYIVQVTDANGCSQIDSVYITVHPLPIANAGPDQTICSGFSATLTASGGTSYLWTPGAFTTSSIIVSPSATTSYIVKVTDANGCQNNDTVQVTVNPTPGANAGLDQTICSGSSATLTATGGASYLWTPGGGTTSTIIVSPVSSTNYIVTVSDSIGCQNKDTVHVTLNPLPAANAGSNVSICLGASTTLTATPAGASYLWTPTGSTNAAITVSPIVTTNYFLTVTDTNGCSKIDSVLVTVYPAAIANAGADQTICSGFQATLTASGGVSYLWTPGGATASSITVSPIVTTDYIVKVTDANGCQDYDTVVVNINPYISGSASTQSICIGSSTTLNASGGVSYLWFPSGSTNDSITVSPQSATDYIVHITTPIGCLIYDTIHINVNPLPIANAGSDTAICKGSNTTLTASGGTSYLWITTGSTGASIVVSPATGQNYIVQVTDNNGCKQNDTVYVTVHLLPIANAGVDKSVCPGVSTTLTASGGLSYIWSPGGSTSASVIVTPLTPTNYVVQVTDENGCKNKDTVLVTIDPLPVTGFSISHPVCENSPLVFSNSSSVSSGSIVNYQWNFGDGFNSVVTNPVHSYSNSGIYYINLIATTNKGCIDSIKHIVTVNVNPIADFATRNECVWQTDKFHDLSSISSGAISQWIWEFGDGTNDVVQNPTHTYSQAGLYDINLTVLSDSGCAANIFKAQAVEIYPLPDAHFKAVPSITSIFEPVIHFIDQSTGGIIWQWNFGDNKGTSDLPNPFYSYSDTGIFNVSMILESNYGCLDTTYGDVYIVPGFTIYFPNSFSPNGDSKNDFYSAYGIGMSDFDMRIYDRWGNEIFHSDNVSIPWNGKSERNNLNCSEGVYVYKAKATDYKNVKHEFSGTITLIR